MNFLRTKSAIIGLLVFGAAEFVVQSKPIRARSYRELYNRADIIVVARPLQTKETDEQTHFDGITPTVPVVGLSSEFEARFVLKGDGDLSRFIVHHYRLANSDQQTVDFPFGLLKPAESRCYLFFLQKESDGRYAPFDQIDPAWTSIFELRAAEWDKMELADFRKWLDAMKWLNRRAPRPFGTMSPEIPPDGGGEGSLDEAALNAKLEKARALLCVNPNLVFNNEGSASQTPLHLAAEYGNNDVAELLLANNADIEAKAYGGWTPLLNAVFGGHKDMVELLLASGAQVNIRDSVGRTPLHVAAEHGRTDIAALLRQRGGVE